MPEYPEDSGQTLPSRERTSQTDRGAYLSRNTGKPRDWGDMPAFQLPLQERGKQASLFDSWSPPWLCGVLRPGDVVGGCRGAPGARGPLTWHAG